jgi:TetR/AcrR family tetracycline transcriptional repressor
MRAYGFGTCGPAVSHERLLERLGGPAADEIPDQEDRPDNLEDAVALQLPHLSRVRGRDFFSFGVDTIIAGLHARLEAKSQA